MSCVSYSHPNNTSDKKQQRYREKVEFYVNPDSFRAMCEEERSRQNVLGQTKRPAAIERTFRVWVPLHHRIVLSRDPLQGETPGRVWKIQSINRYNLTAVNHLKDLGNLSFSKHIIHICNKISSAFRFLSRNCTKFHKIIYLKLYTLYFYDRTQNTVLLYSYSLVVNAA